MPVVVEITGRKWKKLAERIARNHSLSEGVIKGREKMVIFSMPKHNESDTNRKGSTKRRSRLWNHLIWSYEQKDMSYRRSGTFL